MEDNKTPTMSPLEAPKVDTNAASTSAVKASTKVETAKVETTKVEPIKTESAKVETAKIASTKPVKAEDLHTGMVAEIKALNFTPSDKIEVVIKVYNGAMGATEHALPHTTKAVMAMKA